MPETYRIVRHFQRSGAKRTILRGLTLALAQLHCNDPQTCSDTCTTAVGRRRTSRNGRPGAAGAGHSRRGAARVQGA